MTWRSCRQAYYQSRQPFNHDADGDMQYNLCVCLSGTDFSNKYHRARVYKIVNSDIYMFLSIVEQKSISGSEL